MFVLVRVLIYNLDETWFMMILQHFFLKTFIKVVDIKIWTPTFNSFSYFAFWEKKP